MERQLGAEGAKRYLRSVVDYSRQGWAPVILVLLVVPWWVAFSWLPSQIPVPAWVAVLMVPVVVVVDVVGAVAVVHGLDRVSRIRGRPPRDRIERHVERHRDPSGGTANTLIHPPSSAPAQSFMVREGLRFRHLIVWGAGVLGLAWVGIWRVERGSHPLLIWPLVVVMALVLLYAAYRVMGRGVGADPGGVSVVEFRRTYRIPWHELREVTFERDPWEPEVYRLGFDLRNGGLVTATKPTGEGSGGGDLDRLRDRIYAVREAALPGQFQAREPTHGKARLVSVRRRWAEPAAVEVAAIFPLPAGRYRHRRVHCSGSDLRSGLEYMFDPDRDLLISGGEPSVRRWVRDQDYATAREAKESDWAVDPGGWLDEVAFRRKVQGDEFEASLEPEAQRLGALGMVVVGAASLTAFMAVFGVAILLDIETDSDAAGEAVLSVVAIAGLAAAWLVWYSLADLVARRNLAREITRRGPSDEVAPHRRFEPDPMEGRQASSHVQDDNPPVDAQHVKAAPDPQDVQDTVADPDP